MDSSLIRKLQGLGKGVMCEYDPHDGLWSVRNTAGIVLLSGWDGGILLGGFIKSEHPDLEVAIQSFLDMAGGK